MWPSILSLLLFTLVLKNIENEKPCSKNWFNVDKRRLEVRGPGSGQAIPVDIHYSLCSGYLWYCTTGKIRTTRRQLTKWCTFLFNDVREMCHEYDFNKLPSGRLNFAHILRAFILAQMQLISMTTLHYGNRSRDFSLFQVLRIYLHCCSHPGYFFCNPFPACFTSITFNTFRVHDLNTQDIVKENLLLSAFLFISLLGNGKWASKTWF